LLGGVFVLAAGMVGYLVFLLPRRPPGHLPLHVPSTEGRRVERIQRDLVAADAKVQRAMDQPDIGTQARELAKLFGAAP